MTVKTAPVVLAFPSGALAVLVIETVGGASSSTIVSTAAAGVPIVAPLVGLLSVTLTVSSSPSSASSTIGMEIVLLVSPSAKVTANEVPV